MPEKTIPIEPKIKTVWWNCGLEDLRLSKHTSPPCNICYWWDPAFEYDSEKRSGVVFCRADEMEHDFSCFKPKKEEDVSTTT